MYNPSPIKYNNQVYWLLPIQLNSEERTSFITFSLDAKLEDIRQDKGKRDSKRTVWTVGIDIETILHGGDIPLVADSWNLLDRKIKEALERGSRKLYSIIDVAVYYSHHLPGIILGDAPGVRVSIATWG